MSILSTGEVSFARRCAGPGLFRLLLASVVILYHLSRLAVGLAAVYLFFVLSGFCIYRVWTTRYARLDRSYLPFIRSRFWRLLPSFLLAEVFLFFLRHLHVTNSVDNPVHSIFSQAFLLGYSSLSVMPLIPAWSLDIEVQFYLLAPALIWCMSRCKISHTLVFTAALSCISALSVHGVAVSSYLIFFVIGMCAARTDWRPSATIIRVSSISAAGLLIGCLVSPFSSALLVGAHQGPFVAYSPLLNATIALLCAPLALFTTYQVGFSRDAMAGDLSYIVYLFHWPILTGLPVGRLHNPIIHAAVLSASTYAIAFLVWRFYDKPINRLRTKWNESYVSKGKLPFAGSLSTDGDVSARALAPTP